MTVAGSAATADPLRVVVSRSFDRRRIDDIAD
jgi:hypothetical protein